MQIVISASTKDAILKNQHMMYTKYNSYMLKTCET